MLMAGLLAGSLAQQHAPHPGGRACMHAFGPQHGGEEEDPGPYQRPAWGPGLHGAARFRFTHWLAAWVGGAPPPRPGDRTPGADNGFPHFSCPTGRGLRPLPGSHDGGKISSGRRPIPCGDSCHNYFFTLYISSGNSSPVKSKTPISASGLASRSKKEIIHTDIILSISHLHAGVQSVADSGELATIHSGQL